MSKEKNNEVATVTSQVSEKILNSTDLIELLGKAKLGNEISSDYLTIEVGEVKRVLFVEMTEISGMGAQEGEMVEAVSLLSGEDGKYKINADKVIVSTCKKLASKGLKNVGLEITCTGSVKSKTGGKYKEFIIKELIVG